MRQSPGQGRTAARASGPDRTAAQHVGEPMARGADPGKRTPPSRGSAQTCVRVAPAQCRSDAAGPVAQQAARAAAPARVYRPICPHLWRRFRPCQWRESLAGHHPPNTGSLHRKRPAPHPRRRPWLESRSSPAAASVGPRASRAAARAATPSCRRRIPERTPTVHRNTATPQRLWAEPPRAVGVACAACAPC